MHEPTVFIVDDDDAVRKSLNWLIQPLGFRVETFGSALEFLKSFDPTRPGCLVLDVRMPGMSGLELQERLINLEVRPPIIIVTGHADVPMCVRAFENGVYGFVEKPADNKNLFNLIQRAIAHDAQLRDHAVEQAKIRSRLARLTARERQLMELLVAGKPTKFIATTLKISLQTAAKHRCKIFEKVEVGSPVELARLVLSLDRQTPLPQTARDRPSSRLLG